MEQGNNTTRIVNTTRVVYTMKDYLKAVEDDPSFPDKFDTIVYASDGGVVLEKEERIQPQRNNYSFLNVEEEESRILSDSIALPQYARNPDVQELSQYTSGVSNECIIVRKHDNNCSCIECIRNTEMEYQFDLDEWMPVDDEMPTMISATSSGCPGQEIIEARLGGVKRGQFPSQYPLSFSVTGSIPFTQPDIYPRAQDSYSPPMNPEMSSWSTTALSSALHETGSTSVSRGARVEEEENKGERNRIRNARRAELQRERCAKVLELALGPGLGF
jgi:hypothetical protein